MFWRISFQAWILVQSSDSVTTFTANFFCHNHFQPLYLGIQMMINLFPLSNSCETVKLLSVGIRTYWMVSIDMEELELSSQVILLKQYLS